MVYNTLLRRRLGFFDIVAKELSLPWQPYHFKSLENRRIIGGIWPYGWLGHVAASGAFRQLLKNGSAAQHQKIVESINSIAALAEPVNWRELHRHLVQLTKIGPTMKVWSRLLAITRPDLYCTISAPSVRRNLSGLLGLPRNSFDEPGGYIKLLQLIHNSPWYKHSRPTDPEALSIWEKRAAFVDIVCMKKPK